MILVLFVLAFGLFVLEQKIFEKIWDQNLSVSLAFEDDAIYEGDTSVLKEVIENRKVIPIPMLNVKFTTDRNLEFPRDPSSETTDKFYRNDFFTVRGMEKVTRKLKFKGIHRGVYSIDNLDLNVNDFFMANTYSTEVDVRTTIYVYPKPFESPEFLKSFQQLYGELLTRRHLLEDPFEFRGIREYAPYDTMRSINWKATAKTGVLKVNQKNYTAQKAIRIFMNLEDDGVLKREECVEASIQVAAGLSKCFLSQGMKVSVYCNAGDMFTGEKIVCEANAGSRQYMDILRALTRCDIKNIYPFTENFGRELFQNKESFTCLISPNQYSDFVELLKAFDQKKGRFVWFYPVWEMSEPKICEELKQHARVLHIR